MNEDEVKIAVLKLNGANCINCIFAIEHAGRRMPGVKDVEVNGSLKEIYVEYEGDTKPLYDIVDVVHRLGYEAKIEDSYINKL